MQRVCSFTKLSTYLKNLQALFSVFLCSWWSIQNENAVQRCRGQALVKNSKTPQDFRFSNRHSPTQDLIALYLLNGAVPLQSCSLFTVRLQIWIIKWCPSTDFVINIAVSITLKRHFPYSQPGATQFSVALGYGASGKLDPCKIRYW